MNGAGPSRASGGANKPILSRSPLRSGRYGSWTGPAAAAHTTSPGRADSKDPSTLNYSKKRTGL